MYPNLYAEMARAGVKKEDIARELGVSLSCLYQRLNNGKLLGDDMFNIKHKFFPQCTIEYLFAKPESEGANAGISLES